ncbi:MAG TPA: AI-2E family transporter, partial [Caulobacteraceae bacterium]|nr:AI-2E family transporter [Caulobacteraceae bacterium]
MKPPSFPSSTIARNALVIIAVILGVGALRWLSGILSPLLLAMFLAVMVDGFSRVLRRRLPGLPAGTAVLAAIFISTLTLAL